MPMPDDDDTAAPMTRPSKPFALFGGRHRKSETKIPYSVCGDGDATRGRSVRRSFGRIGHNIVPALAALALMGAPAEAGLQVCNKANVTVALAVGLAVGQTWQSRGWWKLPTGACATLVQGPLKARYFYLYGTDGGAGTWSGGKAFCTQPGATFAIAGRGRCAARGYDSKGFFEVDTRDKADWKQTLSD